MCGHNAIPHSLRGELTYGRIQLYIWRLNLTYIVVYFSYVKLVFTLTEDITFQSEPEKQDKNQIWAKIFKTCQILN